MMHYKHGSVVQANKLLESIVQSYPSRTDVWSLFIDAELQAGRIEQTRNLFARVCALKLSTKKMKSFLQRFLKFEQQHGTEKTQEHVKDLARQYITCRLIYLVKRLLLTCWYSKDRITSFDNFKNTTYFCGDCFDCNFCISRCI